MKKSQCSQVVNNFLENIVGQCEATNDVQCIIVLYVYALLLIVNLQSIKS